MATQTFNNLLVARGLLRDTSNNPDHFEILLDFLSAVLCQYFPTILKDFAIAYHVTMTPYNSKSMYYVSLEIKKNLTV